MSLPKLCFATNNKKKLEEITAILGGRYEIVSLKDIGCHEELPEDHETLEENSAQKADYVFQNYGVDCFADDTGLEIDSLGGRPGVYSAMFAGPQRSSDDNMDKVLDLLEEEDERSARFRTVVTLIQGGKMNSFEGIVEGQITREKAGVEGFGYDPIFRPTSEELTFAEMSAEKKNLISHRGRAVQKLVSFLKKNQ